VLTKFFFCIWVVSLPLITSVAGTPPVFIFKAGSLLVTNVNAANSASETDSITNEEWRKILSVYTHEAFLRKIDQPVSGKCKWIGDTITFKPDFTFSPGETYHAVFSQNDLFNTAKIKNDGVGGGKLEFAFTVPKDTFSLTSIEAVYPEAPILPANTLRLYIHFSAPMMAGEAYQHIKLFRENGTPVERAFLIVDQELWDSERKKFTLLFDPGRIKRDLRSNLDLGPPLMEGEKYRLVIDSTWRDIHGNSLVGDFVKTFSVTTAERTKVSTTDWKVIAPLTGSKDDLVIFFDRPLDHALVSKYITINNFSGALTGKVQTVNDSVLRFTPDHPWISGKYEIAVSPFLEDVAGNNINNAFDLDVSENQRVNSREYIRIPFVIQTND
jgi:hypothetical protein